MLIRADLHVHSVSSADGRSTLAQLGQAAKVAGLQAIAICDHNTCTPTEGDFPVLLLPATEVSTDQGHILGLFIKMPLDYPTLTRNGLPSAGEAVEEIHRCGGLAVLAHPFGSSRYDPNTLSEVPLDAIEGANARATMKNKAANRQALALAESRKLPAIGGSDAHSAPELGSCYTELDVTSCTVEALRQGILEGSSRAVFSRECRWLHKGFSQMQKARRRKSIPGKLKAYCYLVVCVLRDLRQREESK